jgi:hypothetical protein
MTDLPAEGWRGDRRPCCAEYVSEPSARLPAAFADANLVGEARIVKT